MKKWYAEEYEFKITVTGFLRGNHTERYCRNGEEIGDQYTCTYGCPVNAEGQGICSKVMLLFPIMEAVHSGGNLQDISGDSPYKDRMPGWLHIIPADSKNWAMRIFTKRSFWIKPREDVLCSSCGMAKEIKFLQ